MLSKEEVEECRCPLDEGWRGGSGGGHFLNSGRVAPEAMPGQVGTALPAHLGTALPAHLGGLPPWVLGFSEFPSLLQSCFWWVSNQRGTGPGGGLVAVPCKPSTHEVSVNCRQDLGPWRGLELQEQQGRRHPWGNTPTRPRVLV